MNKVKYAFLIIIFNVIIVSICAYFYLNNANNLIKRIDRIGQYMDMNMQQEKDAEIQRLRDYIEKNEKVLVYFTLRANIDDVRSNIEKISEYDEKSQLQKQLAITRFSINNNLKLFFTFV